MDVVRLACFALFAALASGQSVELLQISGRVISTSGQPLSKATLELVHFPAGPANAAADRTSQSTGEDGKFVFNNLAAGRYSLLIQRAGYAPFRLIAPIVLSDGQSQKDLEFKFTPQATITGRVTDQDGDPLAKIPTQPIRITYTRTGRRLEYGPTYNTDEAGNFRIAALAPGTYYLSAPFTRPGVRSFANTFFPSSPDLAGASTVSVSAGAELHGMNILVRTDQRLFAIRGKVVDMNTEDPIRAQTVTLAYRDGRRTFGPAALAREDGSFEIKNVPAGTVIVETRLSTNNGKVGQAEVTIRNNDVEGVVLRMAQAMQISGAIKLGGSGQAIPGPFVSLGPVDVPFYDNNPNAQAASDGSFVLRQVAPVRYDVEVHGLPEGMYIRSIHFGDRDATHAPLDLSQGSAGNLEIMLAPHAASVDGNAKPNAVVAVWSKDHPDEGQTAVAGMQGAFHFSNLAPGAYRILAWDDIEPGLAEYSPYRERFNAQAEDSKLTQDLKIIPHDQAQAEQERLP